jgi:alpha,alpha-trehalase
MKNVKKSILILFAVLFAVLFVGCGTESESKSFQVNVEQTLQKLEQHQDTDSDKKITVEDTATKRFELSSLADEIVVIEGNYHLSNLLQELATAKENGLAEVEIDLEKIEEPPTQRISRLIKTKYWDNLTRSIDEDGLQEILEDTKSSNDANKTLYVPYTDTDAIQYYTALETKMNQLKVVVLPENITPSYVKSINKQPGILSLKIQNGKGNPFVVPGGRFNEMYGWDSYFEGIGLNIDGRQDLSISMIENFAYQIEHYGKILNANRSYYLTRSQPPFLTSFIRETYESAEGLNEEWLGEMLNAALKEYFDVWMNQGKKLSNNGLNRYFAEGIGIPPETEEGHFDDYLKEFASKYQMPLAEFIQAYQTGDIIDETVDEYFLHDRSLRESGHDTTWRLDDVCANLNTVALNSLLYKYETDIAYLIKTYFEDSYTYKDKVYVANDWLVKAESRLELMNELMWDDADNLFYDYNLVSNSKRKYQAATNFFPLWAKVATKEQARKLKDKLLSDLKAKGGILASSKFSTESFATNEVERQWDYPNGWAPHQMLLWKGLLNYGYEKEAQELAYRWLWMITKNAVDYNGTIPEKYDVVKCSHKVYAEYGNVGTDFEYITPAGFGWMNASYQYGLTLLNPELVQNLDKLVDPDELFKSSR